MRSEFACSRSVRPGFHWKMYSSALSRRLGSKARLEQKNDPERHTRTDMRRILEQTSKELIQVIRDKRTMLMDIGIPVMLLILLSMFISLNTDELSFFVLAL